MKRSISLLAALLLSHGALAGEPQVTAAKATPGSDGTYRFAVTLRHADEGWDHYADRWEILTPDGESLGVRVLHHPHEHEQPFTRSLGGVKIPPGVTQVRVRAHDSVHGWGSREQMEDLP